MQSCTLRIKKHRGVIHGIVVIAYTFIILYITIFSRSRGFVHSIEIIPLSSYYRWLCGEKYYGNEIALNIGLFFPQGYFFAVFLNCEKSRRNKIGVTILIGFLLSLSIELIQYFLRLGMFQISDIVNNTLGMICGWSIGNVFNKKIERNHFVLMNTSFALLVFVGFAIFANHFENKQTNYETLFEFQIESVEDGEIKGFCFPYGVDAGDEDYCITLRSLTNGHEYLLDTITGIERNDVNSYFEYEYDCTMSGFTASVDLSDDYEVFVRWDSIGNITTNYYIIDGNIKRSNTEIIMDKVKFNAGDIELGTCVAFDVKHDFYVYQDSNNLYWVLGSGFNFDENESTMIEYQLGTTQIQKLPDNRMKYGFDNCVFIFEENEINNSLIRSNYRVAKMALPSNYSITYILTGYIANNSWTIKKYFRPQIIFDR